MHKRIPQIRSPYEIASASLSFLGPGRQRHVALRYGFALAITGLALALSFAFDGPGGRPYYIFVAAVALSTWFGGWAPGLVSLLLASGLAHRFILDASVPDAKVRYAGFLAIAVIIFAMMAALEKALLELRRSHLRFGGIVQISDDAIITVDERQRITLFNPGAESIFGYRAAEVLGQSLNVLLPERYRPMHAAHMQAFANSADVLRPMNRRGTIHGLRKNGTEFPAEASISKFESNGEKIMTVRLRDVSERFSVEEELRRMAAIVESSQDAILAEDLQGRIAAWNPGAEKMYGYTAAEVIGQDARLLLPNDSSDEVAENVRRAREGVSTTYETVRVRKDGKRIDVAMTVSPIRNREGEVVGVSAISRDITERHRLEEQLHHSQKMEAVGRLAGGIAHDFNNLLSVIVGYGYMIQSSSDGDPGLRNSADQIMHAAKRASGLTRQLLAFSRKQVLHPEIVDLNGIVNTLNEMLPRLVGEDVDVRVVQGARLRSVKADPGQIEQCIMNLVVNARDAMPEGGKLTIETANVEFDGEAARQHNVEPGSYVMLAVSDTGQGMDEQTRTRIFEPFFTTKPSGKGTGLGLATVYGIVSQSSGYIWVYSEPGHGTTFKLYFPATAQGAEQAQISEHPELTLCGTETILLVEDEAGVRNLLTQVLEDKGYKVLAAANGPEALRLDRTFDGRIDLLLTDVIMPEMRGPQLGAELLARHPGMLVMYMSGYTDNALMHSGSLPDGTMFLQKPFTPDVVLRRVREVLDKTASEPRTERRVV